MVTPHAHSPTHVPTPHKQLYTCSHTTHTRLNTHNPTRVPTQHAHTHSPTLVPTPHTHSSTRVPTPHTHTQTDTVPDVFSHQIAPHLFPHHTHTVPSVFQHHTHTHTPKHSSRRVLTPDSPTRVPTHTQAHPWPWAFPPSHGAVRLLGRRRFSTAKCNNNYASRCVSVCTSLHGL